MFKLQMASQETVCTDTIPLKGNHLLMFPIAVNLFTTIHDGNFRRHSSMNVTIK